MSEIQNISEASLLDNIFEGRNKSYGAYESRTNSSKRTVFALLVSSIFFIVLVFVLFVVIDRVKISSKNEITIKKIKK